MSTNQLPTLSTLQMHQMIFIYNAVIAGWSVKRVPSTGNFRFKKRLQNRAERITYQQDSFLQKFVQNMQKLEVVAQESHQVESFELPIDQDVPT